MPKTVRQSLLEKGWEEKDIAKVEEILYSAEKQDKHYGYLRSVNPIIYWMGLFVAIIGNMIISVFLIPFFLVMSDIQLYVIIGTMGLVFGAMFNFLLRDIEHVDYKHHVVAGVFIPALGAITIFVVVTIANNFAKIMQTSIHQNVWIVALIYVLTFTTPHIIYKYSDVKKEKMHAEGNIPKTKRAKERDAKRAKTEEMESNTPEVSSAEAWKVYQARQQMEESRVHDKMLDKYKKYL